MNNTDNKSERYRTSFQKLLSGDSAFLARAITALETGGSNADKLANLLRVHTGDALVIGFTGPPGSGKSTLIDSFIKLLRTHDKKIAVLAVDPSSPISGGAVLGDRTRMGTHTSDRHVFIRSIAARGHLGGLSVSIPSIIDAVDAAGWPIIILETVGTGQSETEIMELADIRVVVNSPGLGDDIQAIKAGVLEIADILVVNKCDKPLSDNLVDQLKSMLELRSSERKNVPIISTSAIKETGLKELYETVKNISKTFKKTYKAVRKSNRLKANLLRKTEQLFSSRLKEINSRKLESILNELNQGSISNGDAAEMMLNLCLRN
jgi:LAO/AO transport system kinase